MSVLVIMEKMDGEKMKQELSQEDIERSIRGLDKTIKSLENIKVDLLKRQLEKKSEEPRIILNLEHCKNLAEIRKTVHRLNEQSISLDFFEFEMSKMLFDEVNNNYVDINDLTYDGVPFTVVDRIDKDKVKEIINKVFKRGTSNLPLNYHVDLLKELEMI